MRLRLVFSRSSDSSSCAAICPKCGGDRQEIKLWQVVEKHVNDIVCQEVKVYRYRGQQCGHTFRVYPPGISRAHTSQRVLRTAVLLYLMGLGYGGVARALEALGIYMCKSQVYSAVRETLSNRPCRRVRLFGRVRSHGPCSGKLEVQYRGRWVCLTMNVHSTGEWALEVDGLLPEEGAVLAQTLSPLASTVGAVVRVEGEDERAHPPGVAQWNDRYVG